MTDHDREMIQFARSYHQAFVDHAKGRLQLHSQQQKLFERGVITQTERNGYQWGRLDILATPLEIAADGP